MAEQSTQKLLAALLEAGAPVALVEDARGNRFHDYKSSSATPIVDLVTRLRCLGFDDLARRAMDGEFDGTREEAEEWAQSDEGQRTISGLGKPGS